MSSTISGQKSGYQRIVKQSSKGQKSKLPRKKVNSSKSFPWKLVFGVVGIIGAMALLSNPIDPNSIKNVSSAKTGQSGFNGFSLGK